MFFLLPPINIYKPLRTKPLWAVEMFWIIHDEGKVGMEHRACREGIAFYRCGSCGLVGKRHWGNPCYPLHLSDGGRHQGEAVHVRYLSSGAA